MSLDKFGIGFKIWIPVLTLAVFSVILAIYSLTSLRTVLYAERVEKTRTVVEVATSVAQYFHEQEKKGVLSREEATTQARDVIRAISYDGSNYAFAFDKDAKRVVSPKRETEGKNAWDSRDKQGKYLVREMFSVAKQGGGAVPYVWTRKGGKEHLPKSTWAAPFKPWGWVIATGVYMDDVASSFWSAAIKVIMIAALGGLIAGLIAFATIRNVSRPIKALTANMRALAAGDTEIDVEGTERGDEIGDMAGAMEVFVTNERARRTLETRDAERITQDAVRAQAIQQRSLEFETNMNELLGTIGGSVGGLQDAANKLYDGAKRTTTQSEAVAGAASEASANVETVASAAEELSASVAEISRQVSNSSEIVSQAAVQADATNERIHGLSKAASRIGEVVNLIQDIAEQTNLLALNATIEAARAGEMGKGFAVVASEVKTLANQTARATEEISGQISAIQQETQHAVDAITEITGTVGKINEITASISVSVEEQGAATNEIARNVQEASRGTQGVSHNIAGVSEAAGVTSTAADLVFNASKDLEQKSADLRQQVDGFLASIKSDADKAA